MEFFVEKTNLLRGADYIKLMTEVKYFYNSTSKNLQHELAGDLLERQHGVNKIIQLTRPLKYIPSEALGMEASDIHQSNLNSIE
jgi:hypothetical protein